MPRGSLANQKATPANGNRRLRRQPRSVPAVGTPRPRAWSLPTQLQKPLRHLWPLTFILVFEEHERIPPVLFPHPLYPCLQLCIAIFGPPQPQIAPISGRHERNLQSVLGLGEAQRR